MERHSYLFISLCSYPFPHSTDATEPLNNIVEQDHRFIKKRTKPMLGFKSFSSAEITIAGIENVRMIQKKQITGSDNNVSTFENFAMLMAA